MKKKLAKYTIRMSRSTHPQCSVCCSSRNTRMIGVINKHRNYSNYFTTFSLAMFDPRKMWKYGCVMLCLKTGYHPPKKVLYLAHFHNATILSPKNPNHSSPMKKISKNPNHSSPNKLKTGNPDQLRIFVAIP